MKGSRSRSARLGGSGSRSARLGGARTSLSLRRIPRTPIAAAIALACPARDGSSSSKRSSSPRRSARRTCRTFRSASRRSARSSSSSCTSTISRTTWQMLPSVTMAPGAGGGYGAGAGFAAVYMRGVTTGGDGQAITSVPSVGMYLDEQPITTIQGNLDIHMYDIARVEALAGPQGTLYGASSQAGTIRIITNRPDPTAFDAGYGARSATWSTGTMRATSPRASSTCRSGIRPRSGSWAGTARMPAGSTTCWRRARSRWT